MRSDKAPPPQYTIKDNLKPDSQTRTSWMKKRISNLFFPRFYAIVTWVGISIWGVIYYRNLSKNSEKNKTSGEITSATEPKEMNVVSKGRREDRPIITTNKKGNIEIQSRMPGLGLVTLEYPDSKIVKDKDGNIVLDEYGYPKIKETSFAKFLKKYI